MNDDTRMSSTDTTRFTNAKNATIWDPRADLDDDGDVDSADQTLYDAKYPTWSSLFVFPTVAQAFSDVDNPFMFQGVPHFAVDTNVAETEDRLSLNHHRARIEDCATGRWCTRDSLSYNYNYYASSHHFLEYYERSIDQLTPSPASITSEWAYDIDVMPFEYLNSDPNNNFDPDGFAAIPPSKPRYNWRILRKTWHRTPLYWLPHLNRLKPVYLA